MTGGGGRNKDERDNKKACANRFDPPKETGGRKGRERERVGGGGGVEIPLHLNGFSSLSSHLVSFRRSSSPSSPPFFLLLPSLSLLHPLKVSPTHFHSNFSLFELFFSFFLPKNRFQADAVFSNEFFFSIFMYFFQRFSSFSFTSNFFFRFLFCSLFHFIVTVFFFNFMNKLLKFCIANGFQS